MDHAVCQLKDVGLNKYDQYFCTVCEKIFPLTFRQEVATGKMGAGVLSQLDEKCGRTPKLVKVNITYFKQSGKYYTASEIMVPFKNHVHHLVESIKELRLQSKLPGVSSGKYFYIHLDCDELEFGYPVLIKPLEKEEE